MEVQFHAFLTSAPDGSEWSPSYTGRFTPGVRAPGNTGEEAGWAPEML